MFQPEQESMPRGDLERVQSERLVALLERLRNVDSPYWKEKLTDAGPVASIADIANLPFSYKDEFRQTYPTGMLATDLSDVVRFHASSGTSGKPTIVAYTANDISLFADLNARAMAGAGGSHEDIVHNAYGYGLFTGGLGLHFGAERLGAATVPASGGNPNFQIGLIVDMGATGLASTPSFAMLLAERAEQLGMMGHIRLRWGIHGAEPWSEGFRQKLQEAWGGEYDACDLYGLSEIIGPGVAAECRQNKGGLHIAEDHFLAEIVDPETGEPVPDGELGELVLTTLTKEAQPVFRYRTRDLTRFLDHGCSCGRTTRRMGRLEGRADDMLIIRGINVHPRLVETVVLDDPDVGGNYAIIVDRRATLPELEVRLELADDSLRDRRQEITERVERRLWENVRIRITVDLRDPGSIPRPELGKARRVFERTTDEDPLG